MYFQEIWGLLKQLGKKYMTTEVDNILNLSQWYQT